MYKINSFKGENYFLSNFYGAFVYFEDIGYQNNESAFQAQKCKNAIARVKFQYLNPSQAKQLGRRVLLREDWENVKISIMKSIVKAKFVQHPELAKKLLDTKNAYLEEGNTWGDRIWGTVNGIGQNNLGKILMDVRAEFEQTLKI